MDEKPILVFWETTRACDLACRHCRASAISQPLPGELSHEEGLALLDQIAAFGKPSPILILTGGDVLKRHGLFDLIAAARARGIAVSVSPSVTPLLTEARIDELVAAGVDAMSVSIDGASAETHDGMRGVPGTWARSFEIMRYAIQAGLKVQVNSAVTAENLHELPALFAAIHDVPVNIWEVFFLIQTGRGKGLHEPTPEECEAVCWLLYRAAFYGITVRTVEGPFFRRVSRDIEAGADMPPLAAQLVNDLHVRLGPGGSRPRARSAYTRDGKGIVFVSHNGLVSPSGFLPAYVDNVRRTPLSTIYRDNTLFQALRAASGFQGACGTCELRELCGGSRARAFAHSGNPFGEDPACLLTRQHEGVARAAGA
ncbi:MAG: TIGR04053 family radical SAM/SPASM domain-containing protein [Candidatus Xenobia bacterium]